jgi:hypothetical protein
MKNIKLHEDTFDELDALRKESGLKWDDYVRQLWEQSTDDGKTWNTVFDGHYRRKK